MGKENMIFLVTRAQSGDQAALQALLEGCYQDLYYFAYKTVKNEDLACDITQESCIEIMTTLDKLREPAAFAVWARRITYHQCTRHFRETKEVQAEENEDGETVFDRIADESENSMPEQVYENKEFRQIMQELLDSLPAEQRSALLLYYFEKLSVKEIADIHGTTEGTVKSRLNYGRKAVKAKVEDYEKKNNIRLHSFASLPLLLYWLFRLGAEEASVDAATAVGTAVATASPAATATASTTAATMAGKAPSSFLGKCVAGLLAATVAVGTVWGGAELLQHLQTKNESATSTQPGASETVHVHDYAQDWQRDDAGHWHACDCGETTDYDAHTQQDGVCTVCQRKLFSIGLAYNYIPDLDCYELAGIGSCTDTEIIVPAEHQGLAVRTIALGAFAGNTQLVSIHLPDTVTELGNYAFEDCTNLQHVQLSNGLTYISWHAFFGCTSLTEIEIPDAITFLDDSAFEGCTSLAGVSLPDSVTTLGNRVFRGCDSLQQIKLPDSITAIGTNTFENCSALQSVILSDNLALVGNYTFSGCSSLKEVWLPENAKLIDAYAFSQCQSLTTIHFGSQLEVISIWAFVDCIALTEVVLPSGVTCIDGYAFYGCSSLRAITVPKSINQIGCNAFSGCCALTDIFYGGDMAAWHTIDRYTALTGSRWNANSGEFTVHCADGNIPKSEA